MRFLHITDFHLENIESGGENLRKGFYRQFIDDLVDTIAERFGEENAIDLIIASGDFVNKAKFENLPHAKKVLEHLAKSLGLEKDSIITCIGNHDLDLEAEKNGNPKTAREKYSIFSTVFGPPPILEKGYYRLFRKDIKGEEIYMLSLDSTYNCQGMNLPGQLTQEEKEACANDVYDKVPKDAPLLVVSHYPMAVSSKAKFLLEEDDWLKKHLWGSGRDLMDIVLKGRGNCDTVFFFGDGHQPNFFTWGIHHHFMMTGMVGGDYSSPFWEIKDEDGKIIDKNPFHKTNEIKIIDIEFGAVADPVFLTIQYQNDGAFQIKSENGVWKVYESDPRKDMQPNRLSKKVFEETEDVEFEEKEKLSLTLISPSIQKEIINRIRDKKLYSFNRYNASTEKVALGWISINKLFAYDKLHDKNYIFHQCIEKSLNWIRNTLNLDPSSLLIIGIDFWGSIIASNLAARYGGIPVCFTLRKEGRIIIEKEDQGMKDGLVESIIGSMESIENILIVTDVISSGFALTQATEKLQSMLPGSTNPAFFALSIIADKNQKRYKKLNEYSEIASFCTDLPIPVLESSHLPDEEILPPKIRYSPSSEPESHL